MTKVLCHNCCPSIPEGIVTIEAEANLPAEMSLQLIDHHRKYCGECMNKKSFVEWFDPYYIEHLKAYKHLQNTGMWPEGFVPEKIYMEPHWQVLLMAKLANAWLEFKLK